MLRTYSTGGRDASIWRQSTTGQRPSDERLTTNDSQFTVEAPIAGEHGPGTDDR